MIKLIFILILVCKTTSCFFIKNVLNTSNLVFFDGDTYDDRRLFPLAQAAKVLLEPEFDQRKKTLLYIHGFTEKYLTEESIITVINAYLKRRTHNILVLDYEQIAAGDYIFQAVPKTIKFSHLVADALISMVKNGFDIKKLHIVSHSLGSQLASMTSRRLRKRSNLRIKRISALDPAFPLFYPGLIAGHLSKYDAEFVDVIHTDAWMYGAPIATGTADFYPNGGKTTQPGCPTRNYQLLSDNDLCSHWRSWRFWAESVDPSSLKTFQAQKCDSWWSFITGRCHSNEVVNMGLDCPVDIKGKFYLQTNEQSSFARGVDGINYIAEVS